MENRTLTSTQRKKVADLARQGCSLVEVATALGFRQSEAAEIFEDEEHPFNVLYWDVKMEYTLRLRAIAMNIAEYSTDDAVRAKMLEFLTAENVEAFEKKQMHTGFTNIRKLLKIVRQQYNSERVGANSNGTVPRRRRLAQAKAAEKIEEA